MRALVLSNMRPDAGHPERGRFVRDQVDALRRLDDIEVELFEFPPGALALVTAARALRRRYAGRRFDVVHAHFGLTGWPALVVEGRKRGLTLHGTDWSHPRTRALTRLVLPSVDLVCAVSDELAGDIGRRSGKRRAEVRRSGKRRVEVIPCGVDVERFKPIPRAQARDALRLDPERACLLFAADPARPEKRHDRALSLAEALGATLLTLGGVEPELVPSYVNAANAVLVPSDREGFGLAVLEALACDVPVLATPVGAHPKALEGLGGTLCAPFDADRWRAVAAAHLAQADPRVEGRARAERFSSAAMAEPLAQTWRSLLASPG